MTRDREDVDEETPMRGIMWWRLPLAAVTAAALLGGCGSSPPKAGAATQPAAPPAVTGSAALPGAVGATTAASEPTSVPLTGAATPVAPTPAVQSDRARSPRATQAGQATRAQAQLTGAAPRRPGARATAGSA